MALPASGQISINQVNVELGVAGTTQRSFNDSVLRTLFAVASGAISMSNGFGKSNALPVTPGSQTFTSSGTFTVPSFNTLVVIVQGGGGAGHFDPNGLTPDGYNAQASGYNATGQNCTNASGTVNMAARYGGTSSFGSYLSATGGQNAYIPSNFNYTAGAGGTGSGGDQNYTGASGGAGRYYGATNSSPVGTEGYGGNAGGYGGYASGGAGGAVVNGGSWNGASNLVANAGSVYGGGGGSLSRWIEKLEGGVAAGGGGGGLARKSFSAGSLTVGSSISVTVGAGAGAPALVPASGAYIIGGAGAGGRVYISWS